MSVYIYMYILMSFFFAALAQPGGEKRESSVARRESALNVRLEIFANIGCC